MLRRAGQTGVERVRVHVEIVDHVAADHRPLEEVDVVEVMGEPRGVMEIPGGGVAIIAGQRVDDMDGGARRAEMHP